MLEIYGLTKCWKYMEWQNQCLIKRGACPPFNYLLFLAIPYISSILQIHAFRKTIVHTIHIFCVTLPPDNHGDKKSPALVSVQGALSPTHYNIDIYSSGSFAMGIVNLYWGNPTATI